MVQNDIFNQLTSSKSVKVAPGLNVTVSPKRALGITSAKRNFSRKTGIPTTKGGLERKLGKILINALLKIFK